MYWSAQDSTLLTAGLVLPREPAAFGDSARSRQEDRLRELLGLVEDGQKIVIARHGQPVARFVPARRLDRAAAREAAETLKSLRKGRALGRTTPRKLVSGGRKC